MEVKTMKKALISYMKRECEKRPLAFSMMNGLLLAGMEKLLEADFTCPCQYDWNFWLSILHFLGPSLLLFVISFNISGHNCQLSRQFAMSMVNGLVLPMMWSILLFMDGHYYVCLKTYWTGHLVKNDDLIPEKWCEPINTTLAAELEEQTRRWFSQSQMIGMVLIVVLSLSYLSYHCCFCCCCKDGEDHSETRPQQQHQDSDLPVLEISTFI